MQIGDIVWFKGTKDRHGIRRVKQVDSDTFLCEQVLVRHKTSRRDLKTFTPKEIRTGFRDKIFLEYVDPVHPVIFTTHKKDKFGGFCL